MASNDSNKNNDNNSNVNAILEVLKQNGVNPQQVTSMNLRDEDDEKKGHKFWGTQPMPHQGSTHPEGPIQPNKKPEEIRAEPYNMPAGFEWSNVDVNDDEQRMELYTLLANNYVEDDDCQFRFDYSQEFLLWALTPPGYRDDYFLGVRATKTKKLVAFISAIPANVHVYERHPELDVVEINFLCVHKKLRAKRLAPVLIKEITRRVNLTGVFQAVYTAGVVLPVPVASARYYHRSLNPKKLVRVGFSRANARMTMARMQKLYKLPTEPSCKELIPMAEEHVDAVHELLVNYLKKFPLHVNFTKEEVAHWLLPREGVINTYVRADSDGKVTDMISYYHLPSTILNIDETLHAAYSYYNVATSMPLAELMRDALILANKGGTDVFNALSLMENETFLDELKFGKGDGNLQYYVYNWSCAEMRAKDVGIVLL